MIDYGRIRGTVRPEEKVIDEYSVWINTDVTEVEIVDECGKRIEYEFAQKRFTKDEYLKMLIEDNSVAELENAVLELAEIIGG